MELNVGTSADSGNALSQAGTVVEKAAQTTRSKSVLARAGSAMSALTLGARVLPAARRLVKRNPLMGTLVIAATIGALLVLYSRRSRA